MKHPNIAPIYVLSIAGFDPSAGAGVLADIKTFEQIGVYGFGVASAITYQTEDKFIGLSWVKLKQIRRQIKPLFQQYPIQFVKIGLIENMDVLFQLIKYLKKLNNKIVIIWDPIIKASAGYKFHQKKEIKIALKKCLKEITIVMPNWNEVLWLTHEQDAILAATQLSNYCSVYLKGGHSIETPGTDILFHQHKMEILHPEQYTELNKHGSGCVLSAALLSYLALSNDLLFAAKQAKNYTLNFLLSSDKLLGIHNKD